MPRLWQNIQDQIQPQSALELRAQKVLLRLRGLRQDLLDVRISVSPSDGSQQHSGIEEVRVRDLPQKIHPKQASSKTYADPYYQTTQLPVLLGDFQAEGPLEPAHHRPPLPHHGQVVRVPVPGLSGQVPERRKTPATHEVARRQRRSSVRDLRQENHPEKESAHPHAHVSRRPQGSATSQVFGLRFHLRLSVKVGGSLGRQPAPQHRSQRRRQAERA